MINLEEILRFDIDQSKISFEGYLDDDLALVKVIVTDTRTNAHQIPITLEMLQEAAPTLKGKAFVAKYNDSIEDVEGHEKDETPFGFFPEEGTIVLSDDGYYEIHAPAIIFKSYCQDIYDLFLEKAKIGETPKKSVSMEARVLKTEKVFENGMYKNIPKKFSYKGVTLLGEARNPAISKASATLISNFEEAKENAEIKFFAMEKSIEIDNSKESSVDSQSWSNPGKSLYDKIIGLPNEKSLLNEAYLIVDDDYDSAPSSALHYPHHKVVDGKLVVSIKGIQAANSRAAQQGIRTGKILDHIKKHYDELGLSKESFENKIPEKENNNLANKEKDISIVSVDEQQMEMPQIPENDKKPTESTAPEINYQVEYEKIKKDFEKFKEDNKTYMEELETLRAEKVIQKETQKMFEIETVLAEVKDILPSEKIEEFKAGVSELKFEDVDGYKNKIKAEALNFTLKENKPENRVPFTKNFSSEGRKKFDWAKGE